MFPKKKMWYAWCLNLAEDVSGIQTKNGMRIETGEPGLRLPCQIDQIILSMGNCRIWLKDKMAVTIVWSKLWQILICATSQSFLWTLLEKANYCCKPQVVIYTLRRNFHILTHPPIADKLQWSFLGILGFNIALESERNLMLSKLQVEKGLSSIKPFLILWTWAV